MRVIKQTGQFKRDLKREAKGPHRATQSHPGEGFRRHRRGAGKGRTTGRKIPCPPLGGDWVDYRDCHIKPDLVLIYRKQDTERLELVRLGSHSELGL
jgi:mRNA interferase YafQ